MEHKYHYINLFIPSHPSEFDTLTQRCFELGADAVSNTLYNEKDHLVVLTHNPEEFKKQFIISKSEEVSDWENAWVEHFKGANLTPDTFIQSFSQDNTLPSDKKRIILLDPKDAFGDGAHATTQLCAEALENFKEKNPEFSSCMDIGTGTGVLAILAEKLGFTRINAVDIDPLSVAKAQGNCRLNAAQFITVSQESIFDLQTENPYDIVIANIHTSILISSLKILTSLCSTNGKIIVSGIGKQWEQEFKSGVLKIKELTLITRQERDGWLCFTIKKKTP